MDARQRLASERLLGIIRSPSAEGAAAAAQAAIGAGLAIVEFTLNTPGALGLIERFAGEGCLVGAGTVTDREQAESAVAAGARFIVTPVATRAVVDTCRRADTVVICGAATPTEIWNAYRWGSDLVKVFPIAALGGAAYLRLLRGPLPDIPLLVSGGVDAANLAGLLEAGARVAGLTTALFVPELLAAGDQQGIAERTRQFLGIRDRCAPERCTEAARAPRRDC